MTCKSCNKENMENKDSLKKENENKDQVDNNQINNNQIQSSLQQPNNYLFPKEFNGGILLDPSDLYPSMNDCDHNTLYPINALDVDYGNKFPECRCNEFIRPP
jgi:hypothetical protein